MAKRLLIIFFLLPAVVQAQTFVWWKNLVNWDGKTDWWSYQTTNAKYYGPNAFTIPAINNGDIDSSTSLGLTGSMHFSKGDNTQNFTIYGNYASKDHNIAVDAYFIPYEHFKLSHAIKEERRVYYKGYNMTHTVGDVIVNTTIRMFNKWRPRFQTAVRVGVRMPSGGAQDAARYADVPFYWIDFGGSLPFRNSNWKWVTNAGFLVWQTNDAHLRQDDAFLFGMGLEYNHNGFRFQGYTGGYLGYMENGDKPIVVRMNFEKKMSRYTYLFRLQQGVYDFNYFTVETGARYMFR